MLKILGSIFVLAGCCGGGWYYANGYALRIKILCELQQAMQFIYGEIEFSACDMSEILLSLSKRGYYYATFWRRLANRIMQRDGSGFYTCWKKEMPEIQGYRFLRSQDKELLQTVGQNLGNMDRQTQLHTLQLFQTRLQYVIDDARNNYKGQAKVSQVIGVATGVFITLLLF